MARLTGKSVAAIRQRAVALHETNPMLGHRGCRLGIAYPEIYEMQAAAIFEAAVEVTQEICTPVAPEIMVPLIATGALKKLSIESVDTSPNTRLPTIPTTMPSIEHIRVIS